MLNKEYVQKLKIEGNGSIGHLINEFSDSSSITFILEHLGKLPDNFDGSFLNTLLSHKNTSVRLWAVKTVGKLSTNTFLPLLYEHYYQEKDTTVKREIVSSIGRIRNEKSIPTLFAILKDADPKIVCQAIRGLFVFKRNKDVEKKLKALANHPNEMVRTIINKEYFKEKKSGKTHAHAEALEYLKNVVVKGDTIQIMKTLKKESIHLTFTSPPYYNARDYSIYPSYKHYLEFLRDVFKEVYRITKEGRFLILNTSPVIVPRVSRAHSSKRYPIPFDIHPYLVKMGWDFIDDIVWMKPEASVKNRVGGFMQHKKPLGYKPNAVTEYLMVYRKKTDKLLDWNMKQYDEEIIKESKVNGKFESTNVWQIDPSFSKSHSAIFPAELCRRVIEYYSYKKDLIFDPFAGSGTVGKVAQKLGRYFFLTEQDENYFNHIKLMEQDIFEKPTPMYFSFTEFKKTLP